MNKKELKKVAKKKDRQIDNLMDALLHSVNSVKGEAEKKDDIKSGFALKGKEYLDSLEEKNYFNELQMNKNEELEYYKNRISKLEMKNQKLQMEMQDIKFILRGIGISYGVVNPLTPTKNIMKDWKKFIKRHYAANMKKCSARKSFLELLW